MRSGLRLVILLGLILLLASPAVAESPIADLRGNTVSWEGDQTVVSGEVVVLSSRTESTDPSIQIIASEIEVSWDQADFYVEAGAVYFPGVQDQTIHQGSATYSEATITGVASRANRFLYAFPSGDGLQVSATCP